MRLPLPAPAVRYSALPLTVPLAQLPRSVRLFPVWFFVTYLTGTVLLFAFGPWPWPVENSFSLYTFLVLAHCALVAGYMVGIQDIPRGYSGRSARSVLRWSVWLALVWAIPGFILRTNGAVLNPIAAAELVWSGLTQPGVVYDLHQIQAATVPAPRVLDLASWFFHPIVWLCVPLGVYYWNRLATLWRVAVIVCALADVAGWIAVGTNKGIADLAIVVTSLLVAGHSKAIARMKPRRIVGAIFLGTVLFAFFLAFYGAGQAGRGRGETTSHDGYAKIFADEDHPLVRFLPPDVKRAALAGLSYLTQGYYGLSLAMQEPFVTTYGVGNSYFTMGISRKLFGTDAVFERTYAARIRQSKWDAFRRWHSFYTWIASDVSFPGTIAIVFCVGWLLAKLWLDVIRGDNVYAVGLFPLVLIMLFYFPANNQTLAFSHTALPFWWLLFMWRLTRGSARSSSRVPVRVSR
jgi:hypothetical protein